jgi:hypothetical protein
MVCRLAGKTCWAVNGIAGLRLSPPEPLAGYSDNK